MPHGDIQIDGSTTAESVRDRAKASLDLYWIDEESNLHSAPGTNLILYPKYPEVRMSGFLQRCKSAPSEIMTSRDEGRILFFGVRSDSKVICYAVSAQSSLATELNQLTSPHQTGVFIDLNSLDSETDDTRAVLLKSLKKVCKQQWLSSVKLDKDGVPQPYEAANGGGYTLEAALGIKPNSEAAPDLHGWEVKQFSVDNLETCRAKSVVTLFTPEPVAGLYRDEGVAAFIRKYGYEDTKGRVNRLNVGGIYRLGGLFHERTGLALRLTGYDIKTQKITDFDGGICLVSEAGEVAAKWTFKGILEHWNKKHAQAAYVPSVSKDNPRSYRYGSHVELGEETDALRFLSGIASGLVYYDPGIKMENANSENPKIKRRSQFRIKHKDLKELYKSYSFIELNEV